MSHSEAAQGNHPNLMDQTAITPPVAASDSSPLSEARSEHELYSIETIEQVSNQNVKGDGRQAESPSPSSMSSAWPTPAGEVSPSDGEDPMYKCDNCSKPYVNEKSLKRHLVDKKTKCFKSRPDVSQEHWSCPRCHASMSKKYSVERHIRESCWKICDECVENDSEECDASNKEGDCTTCVNASKTCTKHDKPIADCAPELLIDAPTKPNNAESRLRAATHAATKQQRSERRKREADGSPDASPQSKPKRKSRARKTEDGAARQFINETMETSQSGLGIKLTQGQSVRRRVASSLPSQPLQGHESMRPRLPPTVPSQPVQSHKDIKRPSLLPPFEPKTRNSPDDYKPQDQAFPVQERGLGNDSADPYQLGMLPSSNMRSYLGMPTSSGMPPPVVVPTGAPYNSQYVSTQELLRRQRQGLINMQLASQYPTQLAMGTQYGAPVSDLRSSLHLGENGWPPQPYAYGPGNARASLPSNFQVQQSRPLDHINSADRSTFGFSAPSSQAQSRRSSIADLEQSTGSNFMLPHALGNNSRAQSRQSSVAGGQRSALGSRAQSRQASRQSSAEQLVPRPANLNQTDANPRLVVKLPLPRELKIDLNSTAPLGSQHSKQQPLCLRIHSNTYDANDTPIFSILSIMRDEPFGPRLNYYCEVRNKRYNVDYKFMYKYPAPTPGNLTRKRYYDITWNVTPAQLRDNEYPGSALKDGDTIWVLHPRSPIGDNADELGTQLAVQRIHIRDGETFQDPGVMDAWYGNAESTLASARNEIAELKNQLAAHEQALKARGTQVQELAARNAQLVGENGQLRRALVPGMGLAVCGGMPQQHMHMGQDDAQDPQMVQFRARQMAAQRYGGMDQGQGHPALYPTAGYGNQTYGNLGYAPQMGAFSAPTTQQHRQAPMDDDEDAEGEDEE